MRKLREEIEQTLNEQKKTLEVSPFIDNAYYIIEGWIEGLEYVLGQIDAISNTGEPTVSEIQQDTLKVVTEWFDVYGGDENEWRRLEQALRLPLTPLSWEGEEE